MAAEGIRKLGRRCMASAAGHLKIAAGLVPLLFLLLGLFTQPVHAGELSLLVNGKAIHINPPAGSNYNESNLGAGIQYEFELIDEKWVPFVTASGFSDSNRNPSYYAGGGIMRRYQVSEKLDLHFDAGVVAFLMTRKDFKNNDPFLGVLPAVSIGTDRVSLNMTFVPKVDPKMTALFFFQLKVNLTKP